MIKIDKTAEPNSWTEHRLTAGAQYEATSDLRDALLADQGFICAYCMRRIPTNDKGATETTRIEHVIPQSTLTREQAMVYNNLVICCPGAIASTTERECHCDRHKREIRISFTPLDQNFINTISYTHDGSIKSSNPIYEQEINQILNLNINLLKANRKAVRRKLIESLGKNGWRRSNLERILSIYQEKDIHGKKKEYCGVVISYLTDKLQKLP